MNFHSFTIVYILHHSFSTLLIRYHVHEIIFFLVIVTMMSCDEQYGSICWVWWLLMKLVVMFLISFIVVYLSVILHSHILHLHHRFATFCIRYHGHRIFWIMVIVMMMKYDERYGSIFLNDDWWWSWWSFLFRWCRLLSCILAKR